MKRRYDDKKESVKQYKKKIMWKIEQSDTQCKNVKYWENLEMGLVYEKCKDHSNAGTKIIYQKAGYQENREKL